MLTSLRCARLSVSRAAMWQPQSRHTAPRNSQTRNTPPILKSDNPCGSLLVGRFHVNGSVLRRFDIRKIGFVSQFPILDLGNATASARSDITSSQDAD